MLKLKTQLDIVKYPLWVQIFFPLGGIRCPLADKKIVPAGIQGSQCPLCKFGTHNISESNRAIKLKLKTQLDIVKYSI